MKCPIAIAAFALAGATGLAHADARIAATPTVPGYGQDVVVTVMQATSPVYLPTTRYTRTGSAITIDYDYMFDGFGPTSPTGPNLGYPDLNLGELPPGNYTVVARLTNLYRPDDPPQTTTTNVPVIPPQDWGVYVVPVQPLANQPVQVVVRSAAYFDPASLHVTVSGTTIRVDFTYDSTAPASGTTPPGMTTFASVSAGRLRSGNYVAEGWGTDRAGGAAQRYFSTPFAVSSRSRVVEFYAPDLNHYFISAGAAEIDQLDAGAQGAWLRTGQSFEAWATQQDAPAGAHAVCRFYAMGPNSHFYTGNDSECAGLKAIEQSQRADAAAHGQPFLGWGYEGIAFWALVPSGGQCAAGTQPVWRSFNNRVSQDDANHRFTVDPQMRAAMNTEWYDEGAAFCSPQ
jgi:hypothetical protein